MTEKLPDTKTAVPEPAKSPLSATEMRKILIQSVASADELDQRLKRVFQLSPANASLRLK